MYLVKFKPRPWWRLSCLSRSAGTASSGEGYAGGFPMPGQLQESGRAGARVEERRRELRK